MFLNELHDLGKLVVKAGSCRGPEGAIAQSKKYQVINQSAVTPQRREFVLSSAHDQLYKSVYCICTSSAFTKQEGEEGLNYINPFY